ncbi:hypothetical protein JCM10213_004964 [Rhodosporidiobolus nylandii]
MAAEVQYATHKAPNGGPALSYALHLPADSSAVAKAALIAHPYGRLGGCKEDHVVVALAEMLAREGYAVVRFDARGAGESGGPASWTGAAEADDFRHLVDAVVLPLFTASAPAVPAPSPASPASTPSTAPQVELLLAGYSFGSLAATSCPPPSRRCLSIRTSYLVVSYPLSVLWALTFLQSGRFTAALRDLVRRGGSCVLTVFGDADNFSSVDKLRSWAAGLEKEQGSDSCWTAVEVEGVDHFWREREKKRALLDVVRRWLREEQ